MPGMRVEILPGGGAQLRRIAYLLTKMDEPEVGRIFRAQLREPMVSMRREVKARILSIPTHGTKHTGLRGRIANTVRYSSRTTGRAATVAIWVDVHKMPDGQYSLPIGMEGLKVWRHPTFGGDPWVTQEPHAYFYPVVAVREHDARTAVERAMEEIKQRVGG